MLSATPSPRPPARCYRSPRIISNTITPPTSTVLQISSCYQQHHHPAYQHGATDILVLSATPSPRPPVRCYRYASIISNTITTPTSTVLQITSYYQQHHHPAHQHGATDMLVLSATPSPRLPARCYRYPCVISNTITSASSTVLQITSYYQQHRHPAYQHGATDILVLSVTPSPRPPARCYRSPRIISNTITPPTSTVLHISSCYQQHHHLAYLYGATDMLVLSATPSPHPPARCYRYPRIISNTVTPSSTVSADFYITLTIVYVYCLSPIYLLASKRYNITDENIHIYSI